MIALLCSAALAGPRVDVLYDYQWARTSPVAVFSEDGLQGAPQQQRLDPRRTPLDSGIAAELLFDDVYVLSLGLRGYTAEYRLDGFRFQPHVWDVRADAGAHAWFGWRGEPVIDGYLIGAAGLQGTVMRVEPWPTSIAPALHSFGGIGIANRRGRVHLRAELRVSLGLRLDFFEGRAELPHQALVWRHHPGSATASLLFGIGFGPTGGDRDPSG